jgi:hypothetical protein
MATQTVTLPGLVPPLAAPDIPEYPQFQQVTPPYGTGAYAAWQGSIQPFADDLTARQILRRIEAGEPFENDAGTLFCQRAPTIRPHPADRFLVRMDISFTVIVLQFPQFEHPCAYLLRPELSPRFLSFHPHTRGDCPLVVSKRRLPALCVYSGAIFEFAPGITRIVQFLDQLSTYLARHAIWLRTRVLLRSNNKGPDKIEFRPHPGDPIIDTECGMGTFTRQKPGDLYWNGYWPGKAAPSGSSAHLKTIAQNDPCWCWSGKPYRLCHRPIEQRIVLGPA